MLSILYSRKHNIWQAARDGKQETISGLLTEATAKDLQYEAKYYYWKMPALIVAADRGHLDIVQMLLRSKKVDVNQKSSEDGWTALMRASSIGCLPLVEYLVQQGADIHMLNKIGQTSLMWSSYKGRLPVVQYLVQQGADINTQNEVGKTALTEASSCGYLPIVQYLVEQGADIDTQDKGGLTAFMWASSNGHLPVVQYLLGRGARINMQDTDGNTALLLACRRGKVDVVKVLLQAGADKNIQNKKGKTALSVAKTEEIKKILVEYGQQEASNNHTTEDAVQKSVKPHTPPKIQLAKAAATAVVGKLVDGTPSVQSFTPAAATVPVIAPGTTKAAVKGKTRQRQPVSVEKDIWSASRDGDINTLSQLLPQATAEDLLYEAKYISSMTAMIVAAYRGNLDIVKMLLQSKKVNINQKCSSYGNTALLWASSKGHLSVVQYLVEQGDDINTQGNYGKTALMSAASSGHLPVVQYLVEQGADINMQDGRTALMCAAIYGYLDVVKYLIQQGANIHMQDKYGNTAVMCASSNGYLSVVEYLVEQGAAINRKNKDGSTALINASRKGHLPVVQYLVQQGAKINMQNEDGDTALLLACREGKVGVVKVLLQTGADMFIHNKKDEAAMSMARTEEINKILVEYDQKIMKTTQSQPVNSAVDAAASPIPPSRVCAASADDAALPSPPSPVSLPSTLTTVEKDPKAADGTWYSWLSKTVTTLTTVPAVEADTKTDSAAPISRDINGNEVWLDKHRTQKTTTDPFYPTQQQQSTYFCNSHTIILSELVHNMVPVSARLILRGHFEWADWRGDLHREQCIIKHCGTTDALSGASSPEVVAMRREYEIYLEIQELAKTISTKNTGCVDCFSAHPDFKYLVLEEFGQDLRGLLNANLRRLAQQLVLEGIITAVQALHSHNIMHGDIKPENILYQFDRTGNCMVKLCDLDCAYRCGVQCAATSLGTRYYTAPEVCTAAAQGRTVVASLDKDMFSLGLVLWQVLKRSAAPALQSANPTQLQHMYTDQTALDSFLDYEALYQAILSRVTSLNPRLRPDVTELWKHIIDLSASNAHQNLIHSQTENKFLKISVVDILTSLDEKMNAGQVQLGVYMRAVLRNDAALTEMLQTVLTGCHDIPTYCVIVPIVAKNWADVVSPMRLMQNQYRLYFLCAHTHQIAPCGDKGKGYKIKVHKQWVKDAAPVLQVGLVLLKLGLLAGGIPLPIPDLCSILQTVDQHVQFLDAAFDLLQNPPVDSIMEDYVMSKKLGELPNIQSKDVMQTKDMEKSYSAIKSILEDQGVNIPLTCGLRKVTDCSGRTGKTAWVLDNDATEQAWRNSQ